MVYARRYSKRTRWGKRRRYGRGFRRPYWRRYGRKAANKIYKSPWGARKNGGVLSPSRTVTVRYKGVFTHLNSSNALETPNFGIRLNNPYDPCTNVTGTFNLQSTFWEFYRSIYKSYVVTGAKVNITCHQSSAPNINYMANDISTYVTVPTNPVKWGVQINDTGSLAITTLGSWANLVGDPMTKMSTLRPNAIGNGKSSLQIKWSARKHFGVADVKADRSYGALTNAAPSQSAYLVPFVQVEDASQANIVPFGMNFDVTVSYKVHLRGIQPPSTYPVGARIVEV